jgi:hypothetical protein
MSYYLKPKKMKNLVSARFFYAIALVIALTPDSITLSQNRPVDTPKAGSVILKYHFPADKAVKYLNVSKIVQTMDINGQSMLVNVSSVLGCSIKSVGDLDKNLKLEIKIDSMAQNIESPQGSAGGVIKEVRGKVFTMVLSPEGKEVDLTEAKKVIINVEGSGQTDAAQSFADYFPDLPSGSVNPGYTWTSTDTVDSKSSTMSMLMIIKSDNKLEGFENINGVDCAKISSVLAGTRSMLTQSQGMDIKTTGTFTGNGLLYFAPGEGYFIKQSVTTRLTGTIDITSPESMTFPLVMDMTSVNEIQK